MAALIVGAAVRRPALRARADATPRAGRSALVHRDVSPPNIIVTYAGEVKVIDFGVAKINSSGSQTATGTIKGKLAYMSPEQILARGIDRRSDIFSLGVVLWELRDRLPAVRARERRRDALRDHERSDPAGAPAPAERPRGARGDHLHRARAHAGRPLRHRRGDAGRARAVPRHAAQVRRARARHDARGAVRLDPRRGEAIDRRDPRAVEERLARHEAADRGPRATS